MASPTTVELIAELIERIRLTNTFNNPEVVREFSIYDVTDIESLTSFGGLPLVGVAYEGAEPEGNEVNPATVRRACPAAAIFVKRFSVTIAIEYSSVAAGVDPKPDALNLLDEIRDVLFGYQGIAGRPWRLGGESPVPGDLEGVIFYGQLWQISVPIKGNLPQT